VWPFHTFGLKTDGSTIAVTDVGKGPALLFVHTGFWSFLWRDVIARLSDDFRCVCLDAPGTGLSTRVAPRAITFEHSARSVAAVIEALELRDLTLVIHDLGGPAGLAAAARTPERVSAIAALNTFGWRPSGALFRGMLTLMGSGLIREFDALTQFLPRVTASAFGVARRMDPVSRAAFRGAIGSSGLRSFHYYLHDALHSDPLYEEIGRALVGPFRHLPLLTVFGERNDPLGFQPVWKGLFPEAIQAVVASQAKCGKESTMSASIQTYPAARPSAGTSRVLSILRRVPLVMATLIFTLVGFRNLTNPVGNAAAAGISFHSPGGITAVRIGFGAFPLAFAILAFSCLISTRRLLTGLYMVLTVIGVVTAARLFGVLFDHSAAQVARLLIPETILLILSVIAIRLEEARRLREGSPA